MWRGLGIIPLLLALHRDELIVNGVEYSLPRKSCPARAAHGQCKVNQVQCLQSSQCVDRFLLCDGNDDCENGADEWGVECRNVHGDCPDGKFLCKDTISDCIDRSAFCDGEEDCPNGSDESKEECNNEEFDDYLDDFFGGFVKAESKEDKDDDVHEDSKVPCPSGTYPAECNCTVGLITGGSEVDCAERDISRFPDIFPSSTTTLDLSTNGITAIRRHHLSNLTHLKELDLKRNNIQIIEIDAFEPLKQLEKLHIEAVGLDKLSGVFRNLSNLKYLDLSHNGIATITDDALQGLINLTHLDLEDNQIRELRPEFFADLESLLQLYLSRNNLYILESKTFSGVRNLETLHMVACELRELPTGLFSSLHKLETLDLAHNLLTSITKAHLQGLTSLTYLNMKHNKISSIEPGAFYMAPNIDVVHLDNNRLTSITRVTFEPLRLSSLTLKENFIESIEDNALSDQTCLENLDLGDNSLTIIRNGTFFNLINLDSLHISNNKIHTLQMGSFDSLISLIDLHLRKNPFVTFPVHLFEALGEDGKLEWLYFDHFYMCGFAPHVRHCIPRTDGISTRENLLANALLRSSVWIVAVLAFVGNLCVLLARCFLREDNRIHSFFITNLAVADLLMGLYLIIIGTHDMLFRGEYITHDIMWRSSPMCKICGFLSFLSSEMSVMTLTVITLDRFICIVHPFKFKNRFLGQAAILMVCLWVLWITLGALPVFHTEYFGNYFYGANSVCLPLQINYPFAQGWQFSLIIFVVFNLVAFVFIVYAYLKMFLTIRWSSLAMRSTKKNQEWPLVKRFGLIVLTDFLCWMPIIVMKFVAFGGVQVSNGAYAWFAIFVLPVNSALNPILYTMTTKLFKQKILIPLGILPPKRHKPSDAPSSVDDSLVSKASGTRLSVISSKGRGSVHASKTAPQVKANGNLYSHVVATPPKSTVTTSVTTSATVSPVTAAETTKPLDVTKATTKEVDDVTIATTEQADDAPTAITNQVDDVTTATTKC